MKFFKQISLFIFLTMFLALGSSVSAQSQDPCAGERANLKRLYAQQAEQNKNPNNYSLADANRLAGDITTALTALNNCVAAHGNPTTPAPTQPAAPPQNGSAQPADPSNGSDALHQKLVDAANQAVWDKLIGTKKVAFQCDVPPVDPNITTEAQETFVISGTHESPEVTLTGKSTSTLKNTGQQFSMDFGPYSTNPSRNTKGEVCIAVYFPEKRSLVFTVKGTNGVTEDYTFRAGDTFVSFIASSPDESWFRAAEVCQ